MCAVYRSLYCIKYVYYRLKKVMFVTFSYYIYRTRLYDGFQIYGIFLIYDKYDCTNAKTESMAVFSKYKADLEIAQFSGEKSSI